MLLEENPFKINIFSKFVYLPPPLISNSKSFVNGVYIQRAHFPRDYIRCRHILYSVCGVQRTLAHFLLQFIRLAHINYSPKWQKWNNLNFLLDSVKKNSILSLIEEIFLGKQKQLCEHRIEFWFQNGIYYYVIENVS